MILTSGARVLQSEAGTRFEGSRTGGGELGVATQQSEGTEWVSQDRSGGRCGGLGSRCTPCRARCRRQAGRRDCHTTHLCARVRGAVSETRCVHWQNSYLMGLRVRLDLRYSHGGTGCGSVHNPFRPSRASPSSPSRTVSPGAYRRYHQHQPCSTNCRVRFVPFG